MSEITNTTILAQRRALVASIYSVCNMKPVEIGETYRACGGKMVVCLLFIVRGEQEARLVLHPQYKHHHWDGSRLVECWFALDPEDGEDQM